MPVTNPYSGDTQVANLDKGTNQSSQNPYLTYNPVPQTPAAAQSTAPASFGGSGSALATNNDWSPTQPKAQPVPAPAPAPPLAPHPLPAAPTSWTPPPTGVLSHPAPSGYNSPTPPPGMAAPPGTSWVTDGQGHYGWGYPSGTAQGSPTTLTHPVAGQSPVVSGTGGMTFGQPIIGQPPVPAPQPAQWPTPIQIAPPPGQLTAQPLPQVPLPQQDFWAAAAGAPPQTGPVNWGTPAQPDFWASASQPSNPGTTPPPIPPPLTTAPVATTVMSTGVAPWAAALNGGYAMPQFVNPGGGTIPTQQQWAGMSPAEQTAVASLNWSVNGMSSADLSNYLQRSAPQWNTPMPASYRSY